VSRVINIILVRKNRIQPQTIAALEEAISSGRDITMIHVDDSELDAIVPLQLTAREVKALREAQPRSQTPAPAAPAPQSDGALEQALADGAKRTAAKKSAAKKT